jgi:4-amino-4-deoxy-L-arabinose transferase-like glycosyltransferase
MSSAQRLRRFRRLGLRALGARERWSSRARWCAALGLFVAAFGVRSMHAGDLAPVMDTAAQPGMRMTRRYDMHAVEMLQGAGLVFPRGADPADTGLVSRPPGYSILLAAAYRVVGRGLTLTQLLQNLANSVAPLLVFLLGARALSWRVGFVAGALVALAPHFAYYSNLILPDALCVLPVLLGGLFLLRGRRGSDAVIWCAGGGALFGLATWLRPNMMVLAPFVGAGLVLLSPRRKSLVKAAAMTLASCAAIAPITLRNYLVYGEFVPVSSNSGIVLWEGIADAGGERFGAVPTDR